MFKGSTFWAWRYELPPSYNRRDTPAIPCMNIGMKMPFMQTSEPQKWILPKVSFICRPLTFGNQ